MILALRLILGFILLAALWNERDRWKYWALLVAFIIAMSVFQVEVEREAERDGMCKMAEMFNRSIDDNESLRNSTNIENIRIDLGFCDG